MRASLENGCFYVFLKFSESEWGFLFGSFFIFKSLVNHFHIRPKIQANGHHLYRTAHNHPVCQRARRRSRTRSSHTTARWFMRFKWETLTRNHNRPQFNTTGELIILPQDKTHLEFFQDFSKIIKPTHYFSREVREHFWAFWGFKGDFLTKFGKVLRIIRPTHNFFWERSENNKTHLKSFWDLDLKGGFIINSPVMISTLWSCTNRGNSLRPVNIVVHDNIRISNRLNKV